jgi:hypothetical protein
MSITNMNKTSATDDEWLQWIGVQKIATTAWVEMGDLVRAMAVVSKYLVSAPTLDLRREALAFRGCLLQENHDFGAAISDFIEALAIAEEGGLKRYSLEISLAAVSAQSGDAQGAERWSLAALNTAAADPQECGAGAFLRLLQLRGDRGLQPQEQQLAEKTIRQAWRLFRLEGEPDLKNLTATAQELLQARKNARNF